MRAIVLGVGVAAALIALATPANAEPCTEGATRYSEDSGITYTCRSGDWYEGPYGPEPSPRPTLIYAT